MRLLAPILVLALGLVSCAEPVPETYTEDTRNDFLTACTSPQADGLGHIKLCQCTYEKLKATIAYPRFVEIERLFVVNQRTPLPDEVAQVLADCIVEEVEL